MIIEGAFFKLPELLLSELTSKQQYESTLVSRFAMAVLMELAGRNIPQPIHRIHLERPYPHDQALPSAGRADLFIDLGSIFKPARAQTYAQYGMTPSTWIEAKLFARRRDRKGTETKTSNAGSVALDLFRLCLFVREELTDFRENGRYFLVVFDESPDKYLAFSRKEPTGSDRIWLERLFIPGVNSITFSLEDEPKSLNKLFFPKSSDPDQGMQMRLTVLTREFSPSSHLPNILYWGYLIRILDFEIEFAGKSLSYRGDSDVLWTQEKKQLQNEMIEIVAGY